MKRALRVLDSVNCAGAAIAALALAGCAHVPAAPSPASATATSTPGSAASPARPAATATPTSTAGAPAGPSDAVLKLARSAGMRPEVHNGYTVFCWQDTDVGTRFATKKCVDQDTMMTILDRRQQQRDSLLSAPCMGGCGGK